MVRTRIPCHPFIILGNMADIQYLNYGDQQIEQQALLNNLADQVVGYVESKPWSKKRKEKFMSAYSDIMTRGIVGASNKTGQWIIDVNGAIDFDSKDKKDKEMYQEAAYFIQQQMSGLPTKQSKEEQEKIDKSKLQKFNNDFFTKDFINYLSEQEFGGQKFSTQEQWNPLDKRGDNGLRDTKNRRRILAQRLKEYADSLDETKYNFEEGPFKNLSNFKSRVDVAIRALNTDDNLEDEIAALNALGLNPNDFLYNGANDPSGYSIDGQSLTWEQYNKLKEAEAAKQAAQPPVVTPELAPEPVRGDAYYDYKKDLASENARKREKYLKSSKPGLTSAEWEELAAIGFDIASIVDPEMISAGALALTGSGLRHHALASQPGGMSTSDKWWQAADYGLSILGSIPVLGDAALAARAINNLKKAIVPLGIVMAGANVPQAAKAAYNKVVNGQDLTIQDWRAIGAVLTAAVGVGRGRQMSKRAEALRRTGGNTSKITKEGTIKTSEGEIKVDEATAKQLKEQFKGTNGATRTQKLRENTKVQEAARQQGIDLSKAEVQGHGRFRKSPISQTSSTSTTSGNRIATLRAMSEFNKNHGWFARKGLAEQDWVFRHTGGYTSNPHIGLWQSVKDYFGKSKWDDFGKVQNSNSENSSRVASTTETTAGEAKPVIREQQFDKATINRYKKYMRGNFSDKEITDGSFKFGDGKDISVSVRKTPTGQYDVYINGSKTDVKTDLSKNEAKREIFSLVQSYRKKVNGEKSKKKMSTKEIGKILQDLKRKGWLKQGGKITDEQIDNFLKQYII